MNMQIRDIDKNAYRLLKKQAAKERRSMSDIVNDAIRLYAMEPLQLRRRGRGTLADLPVWDFGPGSERWSEEIDAKGDDRPLRRPTGTSTRSTKRK